MSISPLGKTRDKPASSQALATAVKKCSFTEGQLFFGYPIVKTLNGPFTIDALLISPKNGIVAIDLIEGEILDNYDSRQDDIANKLESRLRMENKLFKGRKLRVPINTLSFTGRGLTDRLPEKPVHPLVSQDSLQSTIDKFQWDDPDRETLYHIVLSTIENLKGIRASTQKRIISIPQSLGAKLKKLEDTLATLDHQQGKAVLSTVEGVQRIRGLAGSGKTIVLALKAAYLHTQHSDWRIAVTFHTRSLKSLFRRLITNFCLEQSGEGTKLETITHHQFLGFSKKRKRERWNLSRILLGT